MPGDKISTEEARPRPDGDASTGYVVTGGFAEISPAGASVLAEEAIPATEASGPRSTAGS